MGHALFGGDPRGCFGGDGSTRIQAGVLIFGFLLRRLQNLQRIEKERLISLGLESCTFLWKSHARAFTHKNLF